MTYEAADLERVFAEQIAAVARTLSEIGAEYMVIGGLAVGIWAEARATRDCDLSVRLHSPHPGLETALARVGLRVRRGDLDRAQRLGEAVRLERVGLADQPIVVDLLFATTPFEMEAIRRRTPVRLLGVDVPVATAEDLFVFKVIAGRPQDLADAHRLLALHGASFDAERVRRWCREFGVEDRLTQFGGTWIG